MKQLARAMCAADLDWSEVVSDARRANEYSSLTPEDAQSTLSGFGRPSIETPESGVVAVVPFDPPTTPKRSRSSSNMLMTE